MLTAISTTATPPVSTTATLPVIANPFTHLITLINRRTSDEQSFEIQTVSDRFVDVLREVTHQKLIRGLRGYELFEAIDLSELPF